MKTTDHAVEVVLVTATAVGFSFLGTLTRLAHEHVHGEPITLMRVLLSIPAAIIMGVIGYVIGEYLATSQGLPAQTPEAIACLLGYLGPTTINRVFDLALEYWAKGKTDEKTKTPGD